MLYALYKMIVRESKVKKDGERERRKENREYRRLGGKRKKKTKVRLERERRKEKREGGRLS